MSFIEHIVKNLFNKYAVFFIYILFISLLGCKPIINNHLHEAEKLLSNAPDSALYILQSVEGNYDDMSEAEKALFGLLYIQACDKECIQLTNTEFIDYSISYYTNKKEKFNLANSYLHKARHYGYQRKYAEDIQNVLKAIELADHNKDHNLLGKAYSELSQVSIYQDESEKALEYVRLSIEHFEKDGDTENSAKMHMVASWAYQQLENSEEAINFSLKAFDLTSDSLVIGDLYNDIGMIYSHMEQYDSALYYSKQSLPYPYYSTNQSSRYYNVATAYFYLDKNDSAIIYATEAFRYPIDIYIESETYRLLANVYHDNDDYENYDKYLIKYHACQDSINMLERQPNINLVEEIHHSHAEKEKIKSQRFFLLIFLLIIILITIAILCYFRNRTNHKETEVNTYKKELDKKHNLLLTEVMDEIQHTKEKYAVQRRNAKFEDREQIDKMVFIEALHIDNEEKFIDKMNKKLNFLPQKLTENYPGITYKEILWCCLFVLKVSTLEISMLLDYTQSSQYKFKQRLVKKLNLKSTKELEELLNDHMTAFQ